MSTGAGRGRDAVHAGVRGAAREDRVRRPGGRRRSCRPRTSSPPSFGVSVITIKHALALLHDAGYIERRPRIGSVVVSTVPTRSGRRGPADDRLHPHQLRRQLRHPGAARAARREHRRGQRRPVADRGPPRPRAAAHRAVRAPRRADPAAVVVGLDPARDPPARAPGASAGHPRPPAGRPAHLDGVLRPRAAPAGRRPSTCSRSGTATSGSSPRPDTSRRSTTGTPASSTRTPPAGTRSTRATSSATSARPSPTRRPRWTTTSLRSRSS